MLETVPERMRSALRTAMKERDRVAVAALRSMLAAISNAEATAAVGGSGRSLSIEQSPVGAGATDVPRKVLSEADVAAIVRSEVDERVATATEYERLGQTDRAAELRAEAAVLAQYQVTE